MFFCSASPSQSHDVCKGSSSSHQHRGSAALGEALYTPQEAEVLEAARAKTAGAKMIVNRSAIAISLSVSFPLPHLARLWCSILRSHEVCSPVPHGHHKACGHCCNACAKVDELTVLPRRVNKCVNCGLDCMARHVSRMCRRESSKETGLCSTVDPTVGRGNRRTCHRSWTNCEPNYEPNYEI